MKFTVKPIKIEKGAQKVDFQGCEIEMSLEEVALHFDNMDKMQDCFDRFTKKSLEALKEAEKMQAEHHAQQMEYLKQQDANDAAYHQRRQEQEVLEHQNRIERETLQHQHWIERYGKDEDE